MENELKILNEKDLKNKIYVIRGVQVMLDSDLAEIYGYEVKRFNEQIKNNIERFDKDFRFQQTKEEVIDLRSKFSTANISSMSRTLPYAFTEQGISMLSSILRSDVAISVSIGIMRAFVEMRKFLATIIYPCSVR